MSGLVLEEDSYTWCMSGALLDMCPAASASIHHGFPLEVVLREWIIWWANNWEANVYKRIWSSPFRVYKPKRPRFKHAFPLGSNCVKTSILKKAGLLHKIVLKLDSPETQCHHCLHFILPSLLYLIRLLLFNNCVAGEDVKMNTSGMVTVVWNSNKGQRHINCYSQKAYDSIAV